MVIEQGNDRKSPIRRFFPLNCIFLNFSFFIYISLSPEGLFLVYLNYIMQMGIVEERVSY